jgi:hypothetical protein
MAQSPENKMLLDAAMISWADVMGWARDVADERKLPPNRRFVVPPGVHHPSPDILRILTTTMNTWSLQRWVRDHAPCIVEGWRHCQQETGVREFWNKGDDPEVQSDNSWIEWIAAFMWVIVDWRGDEPRLPDDWRERCVRLWLDPAPAD